MIQLQRTYFHPNVILNLWLYIVKNGIKNGTIISNKDIWNSAIDYHNEPEYNVVKSMNKRDTDRESSVSYGVGKNSTDKNNKSELTFFRDKKDSSEAGDTSVIKELNISGVNIPNDNSNAKQVNNNNNQMVSLI